MCCNPRKNSVDPLSEIGPLGIAIRDETPREGILFPRQGIA